MQVVIAGAARTPIGAFHGALGPLSAPQLGAVAIRAAMARAAAHPDMVDQVYMGQVLTAGVGQAPARQAALAAGLLESTPTATLNRMCGSGLEALVQAVRAVQLGEARVVVAGGMESMTNAPYLLHGARGGLRLGDGQLTDSILRDGLVDVYEDRHMGSCAEWCATTFNLSREAQDAYAIRSYERAQSATASGAAAREIAPVEVPGKRGSVTLVSVDEGPEKVDFAKLPTLKPAFDAAGTITAANASSLNDGAAALVVTSEAHARAHNMPIHARIVGAASHAVKPLEFTSAPMGAMEKLYAKVGWTAGHVDAYEINEAFAVVPMAAMQAFSLPAARVNVLGGAVALGHPIGASGARIVVTLLNALTHVEGRRGMASICAGGGEAWALALERVD